jgi:hypothetical protein
MRWIFVLIETPLEPVRLADGDPTIRILDHVHPEHLSEIGFRLRRIGSEPTIRQLTDYQPN